jgi:6-phosphogluconate dehydrogenase
MAPTLDVKKIAMIGCGSMGGGMAQLFAENGMTVGLQDPSTEAMDKLIQQAKKDSLCAWLDTPKVFVWSLPHGFVGDKVLEGLMPHLAKGDIIIDAANEHWTNTERRMGIATTKGIRYVGMGVSGGYQAA